MADRIMNGGRNLTIADQIVEGAKGEIDGVVIIVYKEFPDKQFQLTLSISGIPLGVALKIPEFSKDMMVGVFKDAAMTDPKGETE